jgi:biotin carboxylase
MSVLILHRNPLEPFPYDRWLSGYEGDIVVLAARDKIARAGEAVPTGDLGYTRLELMDDFDDEELLFKRALELAAEFAAEYVIAYNEADVNLAAALRERLGLAGAWTADVLPFRDKALMKRRAQASGIEVARHTVPHTAADALAFAAREGFPLVFKDRAGFNAIGLRILHDPGELEDYLAVAYDGSPREDLLLEAFVPGRMCHVDGLVSGGEVVLVWPSQYQYDLASFGTDPGARIDLTLDPADPLTRRLVALTEEILTALRPPGSRLRDHAFHAEIFHTPDDRLVLCEIACRPGGAKIREVFHAIFGVNLGECATRVQVGLPIPTLEPAVPGGSRPRPARMAGQVLMMKRPGRIHSVPAVPEDDWVERFWLYGGPGQVVPPAGGSSDFLTAAVASGPDRAECERRLRALGARFEAQTRIGGTA